MNTDNRRSKSHEMKLVTELMPARLTNTQAAHYLGITSGTLSNWRYLGRGPRFSRDGKVHSRVFYRPCDLDTYIEGSLVD